jgi:hypothetical protein
MTKAGNPVACLALGFAKAVKKFRRFEVFRELHPKFPGTDGK